MSWLIFCVMMLCEDDCMVVVDEDEVFDGMPG